jgi:hypothetical protein
VNVADFRGSQLFCESLAVELRVVPGAGDAADVNDSLDAVRAQDFEECFPGAIGVADCEDGGDFGFERFHDERRSQSKQ